MRGYTYKEFSDLLKSYGWTEDHRKSTHISFTKSGCCHILTLVDRKGELSRPMCKRLLKEAGISC